MAFPPPAGLLSRYLRPVGRITRRIEIYEKDGKTPWIGYPFDQSFLVDGSVSVDYDRDERRVLDLTLDNTEGYFDSNSQSNSLGTTGFWYDKVIKVFRGIEVDIPATPPKILVVADVTGKYMVLRDILKGIGYTNLRINTSASTVADLAGYDIIIANDGDAAPTKGTLLHNAWVAGYSIFTMGSQATSTQYSDIISTTFSTSAGPTAFQPFRNVPNAVGWTQFNTTDTIVCKLPATVPSGVVAFATDGASHFSGVFKMNGSTQMWANISTGKIGSIAGESIQSDKMIQAVFKNLNPNKPIVSWETQIGEFMIDAISEDHFPHHAVIKGRDYTKKLLLAKFAVTTQFLASVSTNTVETLVTNIAINGGIDPNRINITTPPSSSGTRITADATFERDSTRWAACKQLANDYGYEIFFDPFGTLILRPYQDPTTGSPVVTFQTGPNGSLVSYTKSANDSSLFNSITVAGENSDSTVVPVYATMQNTDPNSPSRIAKLGVRSYTYTSPLITTTGQALALAKIYLGIYSLEEYQVDFEAICIDWLEAGDVIDIIPERVVSGMPTRFLFTSFTIPLQLGPMSGTGKRMLIVK